MNYMVVFITCPNIKEAKHISSILVNKKLAACVNIISKIHSIFYWQGKIDKAKEVLLIVKSQKRLFSQIANVVKKYHSYDTPEIIALPLVLGNKKYLHWIKNSTKV